MRPCKTLKSKFGPSLNSTDQRNLLHKSTFKSYHFQPDLPKLPIPTVESTLNRYLTSLSAQEQTMGFVAIEKAKSLSKSEKPAIENLHKMLVDYDSSIKNSSYLDADWKEMYLRDRSGLPYNVTPFIGAKPDPNPKMNEITLRAANLAISGARMCLTLEKEMLEPDLFPIAKNMPEGTKRNLFRNILKYTPSGIKFTPPGNSVPIGLRTMLSYAMLKSAPLDMSQYKNLFRSSRIPEKSKDRLKVTPGTKHVSFQARGRFYKLDVLNSANEILDFESIHKGIQEIYSDAKNRDYNQSQSIGYLSATNRDTWAEARTHLEDISENNRENLSLIDGSILHICLEDAVKKPFTLDLLDFNSSVDDVKLMTETMLWGNGASRWWDKSISWIVTEGGDASVTFEHAWGDGVAVLRFLNETLGENFDEPILVEPCTENTESSSWSLLEFELDEKSEHDILTAKAEYDLNAADMQISAAATEGIGRSFFKKHKLSPDGVAQLAIQAAWQKTTDGEVCPVYQSCSTAAFRGGRTENLRACTIESVQAARMLSTNNFDAAGLKKAIRSAGTKHAALKNEAQMGQGFDRHIFGMKKRAEQAGIEIPELFSDDTFGFMSHFNLSTSTLDSPILSGGGFCPVVPDGLGVGYGFFEESTMCNALSRRSTQKVSPEDFSQAYVETLRQIKIALE